MRPGALIVLLVQALLTGVAVVMSVWTGMPAGASVGLGLLGVSAMATAVPPGVGRNWLGPWTSVGAWAGTLTVLGSLVLASTTRATLSSLLDGYYLGLAWIVAATVFPAACGKGRPSLKGGWRWLAMTWMMLGAWAWLGASYVGDRRGAFLAGLLVVVVLLVSCHFWFRLRTPVIVAVNTLILVIVGLPVLDLGIRWVSSLRADPDPGKQYYLYAVAQRDPAAFRRWWNYYMSQCHQAERQYLTADPDLVLSYRLRPNSRGHIVRSVFTINSRGFRGPEIPAEKGDAYRIVALGESTTFGMTLTPEDRPWPELLEDLIRDRLKPRRPVEVINAGVPGYVLGQNLHRFPTEILPLKPDLVISYHGINAFPDLRAAVPASLGTVLPPYKERPLRLLADAEYRLKLIWFRHRPAPRHNPRHGPPVNPMATPYARLYGQLIQLARTNHIRLALATYSMAVNRDSAPDLIKFYEQGYPSAKWQIQANLVHNAIVRQLAAQHPEVCLVNTQPHLDGEPDKFIDLVHFAPAGEQQMAETVFAALRPLLEEDLSR